MNGGAPGREVRAAPTAVGRAGRTAPDAPSPPVGRVLTRARALPAWVWATAVVVTLGASWAVAIASGTDAGGSRHLFYVPVVLTALRFGIGAAAGVGMAATVLAGPAAVPTSPEVWLPRGPFFIGVGVLVAAFVATLRDEHAREARLIERERELASQRALLIQSISHEFRTPLTVINGVATALAQHEELVAPAARGLVGSLERAADRLGDLISVVLVASETVDRDLREHGSAVDIPDLVEEVATTLSTRGGERVHLTTDPDATTLVTERSQLRLALRCVLDNALKFSGADRPVDVTARRDGRDVVIEVCDRGPGISPEEADRAFRPFAQRDTETASVEGGLGMGLFASRRLVERLGGVLELLPRSGGGLVVRMRLPQRRESDPRDRPRNV